VVKGRYRSVEGDECSVTLHPYRIANFDGSWYLIARDQKNGKVKKYYLRNLSDLSISKKRFEIPQDLERKIQNAINVWFDPHAKPFEVVLYADAVALRYLRRHPLTPTQSIGALDAEGGAEVRLRITHEMEIIPFIYSWIPHIFVMEPKSLAKKALEDAERFVKLQKEAL
jgi:predicted DNA-binding transcriptional regulator YafY